MKNCFTEISLTSLFSFYRKISFFFKKKVFKNYFSFNREYRKWVDFSTKENINDTNFVFDKNKHEIAFLVPGVNISGGIAVIFQHANGLKKNGYNVKIYSLNKVNDSKWFPNQRVEIIGFNNFEKDFYGAEFDVLIATGYSTAFSAAMSNAKRKVYFVQSDESRFFPENKNICKIIRKSYEVPFRYLTEALWIQRWLKEEFGHDAHYVPNGIDLDIFHKTNPIEPKGEKPRILIEGAINVPFKGMDDAYNAIKDLDCEIWIVSNNGKPKKGWRYDKFFENVPFEKMKEIYSSCDVFLKMSRIEGFFGPPMEAMACGCAAVVGKVTGYDEYILDGENALVVEMGDVAGAKKAVQKLIKDDLLKNKLIEGGYETVKDWSWEKSFDYLENIIKNIK